MVYADFGGQTECIMGNWKIENETNLIKMVVRYVRWVVFCWSATEHCPFFFHLISSRVCESSRVCLHTIACMTERFLFSSTHTNTEEI